jgi:GTP-binding protein EngB required for normal cell division
MAADPGKALDTLDMVVTRARDITDDSRLEPYARLSAQARSRLGFLGQTVVIALAGGTGVGKSSLLNAIAGTHVVPAGTIRPTTDRPRVWMPATPEPGLTRLLDSFGIDDRIGHSGRIDVAIIDLPDFDSVDLAHREVVERLVPRVDAIVWVFDPQKYADRAIHEGYLRPLAAHEDRFLFVLNQIDLLAVSDLDIVRADLLTRLAEDGISGVELFTTVAAEGRTAGIDQLRKFIEDRLLAKELVLGKLAHDLAGAVEGVGAVVGVRDGLDFDRRWTDTRDTSAGFLADVVSGIPEITALERTGRRLAVRSGPVAVFVRATEPPRPEAQGRQDAAIQAASGKIDTLVTDLAFESGGFFGARLRSRFDPTEVSRHVRRSLEGAKLADPPEPIESRWWKAASIAQWLMVVALIGSIVWAWARPSTLEKGSWPWPLIVGLIALLLGVGLIRLVRASGTRAGRRAAKLHRDTAVMALGSQLDRRLGVELRTVMRDRAELMGLLTELSIEAAKLEAAVPTV